jgi:uncharacterized protein YaeQ
VPAEGTESLGKLAERAMQLQCTVQEGQVWIGGKTTLVEMEPVPLKL